MATNNTQVGFRARSVEQKLWIARIAVCLGVTVNEAMKMAADMLIEEYKERAAAYVAALKEGESE